MMSGFRGLWKIAAPGVMLAWLRSRRILPWSAYREAGPRGTPELESIRGQ